MIKTPPVSIERWKDMGACCVQGPLNLGRLLTALMAALPAGLLAAPFACGLPVFIMEHISISGTAVHVA